MSILDEETKALKQGDSLKGETAFTLYDTYGFPLDLTQDALRARGIGVDLDAFNAAMEQPARRRRAPPGPARARPRRRRSGFRLREKLGATEFLGYETETAEGVVAALVRDGKEVAELKAGETGAVIVNQTPFYGESGGQVGDTGVMSADGVRFAVTDTQKKAGDLFVHHGTVEQGTLKVGTALALEVDHARRARDPPQPFGDASPARGAAPGARRSRRAEGLAGRARPAALRLLASQADDAPKRSSASRTSPTTSCCRTRRSPPG